MDTKVIHFSDLDDAERIMLTTFRKLNSADKEVYLRFWEADTLDEKRAIHAEFSSEGLAIIQREFAPLLATL